MEKTGHERLCDELLLPNSHREAAQGKRLELCCEAVSSRLLLLAFKKKKKRNSNKVPLHTVIMDSCFKYRETAKAFFNEGIYLSF